MNGIASSRSTALARARETRYDIVVIGGGITGAGVLRDAALRGLSTLLVDKNDFAGGTSSRSSKLVHGGLRYLKYLHFRLVFSACRERWHLMTTLAPHIVKPLCFLLPFYRFSRTPRWLATLGLSLYDLFSVGRKVRGFRRHSVEKMKELEPGLATQDCVGALSYYDCSCIDYRLTVDTIKSGVRQGADVLNYCEVLGISLVPGGTQTVRVRDLLSGEVIAVRARTVINTAGGWADRILELAGQTERFNLKLTRGIHLVVKKERLPITHAIAYEAKKDQRNLLLVPWDHHVLIGTTDVYFTGNPDQVAVTDGDIEYLLESANLYFPESRLERKDIVAAFAGTRPLLGSNEAKRQVKEERLPRDYDIIATPGAMVSITGGKLTTYRLMAQKVLDRALTQCLKNVPSRPCDTLSPLLSPPPEPRDTPPPAAPSGLSPELLRGLVDRYGPDHCLVLEILRRDPSKERILAPGLDYLWAEVDFAVAHEFVQKLSDFMFRRTMIFLCAEGNGTDLAEPVARYLGKLLGWDETRIRRETDQYLQEVGFYAVR